MFILYTNLAFADSIESIHLTFNDFVQGQQVSFDTFIAQRDREFLTMLKEQWQAFEQMSPLVRDAKPKPLVIPQSKSQPESQVKNQSEAKTKETRAVKPVQVALSDKNNEIDEVMPLIDLDHLKGMNSSNNLKSKALTFYGHKLPMPIFLPPAMATLSQQSLVDFWQAILALEYQSPLSFLEQYKQELALSDWAYWLLVQQYSQLHTSNINEARALTWFLLSQSGYQVKLGISGNLLVLLLPVIQTVYAMPYYTIEGQRFYLLTEGESSTISTYKGKYDKVNTALNLSFDKTLKTQPQFNYRELIFTVNDVQAKFSIPYDYQRVSFFKTYPQLDLKYYFSAALNSISADAFRNQLAPLLRGSQFDNVNDLLSFIHQAFPYAIDEAQFGEENYLLIEETLHYQASDCEDRSILFAWLVRNLLGERVVGLDYPGHVSTALNRPEGLLQADPTYIGANLGDVMPEYKNTQPNIVYFD